jgi:KilA-N domain
MSRFMRFDGIKNTDVHIVVDTTNDRFNATFALASYYASKDNSKKVSDWTKTAAAKKLIKAISDKYAIDPIEKVEDDNSDFAGDYMHYIAFDAMLAWIDQMHRLDVLAVIEEYREYKMDELNQELNDALTDAETAQMLLCKVDSMLADLALTEYKEPSTFDVDQVESNLIANTNLIAQQIDAAPVKPNKTIKTSAKGKPAKPTKPAADKTSESNRKKPSSPNYVCLGYDFVDADGKQCHTLYKIAGTPSNVKKSVEKKMEDTEHNWKEVIGMYCSNAVEIRNSIKDRLADYKTQVVQKVNDAKLEEITTHNNALKEEIKEHNKQNPDNKRVFSKEKLSMKKISVRDIPIKATKLTSTYTQNEYISYEMFLDLVRGVELEEKQSADVVDDDETESESENTKRKANAVADHESDEDMSDEEDAMSDTSL